MFAGLWQVNNFFASPQAFVQKCKIGLAGLDKSRCFFELGQAACGLHDGDLEVVAQVAIGVFVVVAFGQAAQLPAKAFAAGVVLAGRAITVAAPVTKAFGDDLQLVMIGEYRTAFAHGDMVRRVKAQRCNVAKAAYHLATVSGAQRKVEGLFCVDEVALNQLEDSDFLTLRRCGALAVAYAPLMAMQHVNRWVHGLGTAIGAWP